MVRLRKTFDFRYADLQWRLVAGMENPSSDERVSYVEPPSYHYLSQHDKVSLLVSATTFSPNNLGIEISIFGDLVD
jgi:hypothetical protein